MWANSVWGFFTLGIGFGLAMLTLSPEQVWLRPWLALAMASCFVTGTLVLLWPLQYEENRTELRIAFQHPLEWIAENIGPKQVIIVGLTGVIIFAAIALAGVIWQGRSPIVKIDTPTVAQEQQPPQPQQSGFFASTTTTESPDQRRYTNRTVRELRALYEGKTAFQADKLMDPYKGMWIETEGTIVGLYADSNGGAVAALRNNSDPIECRFPSDQAKELGTYNNGETLKVRGKLSTSQNGQQIYLIYCEVVTETSVKTATATNSLPLSILTNRYYSAKNKEEVANILDKAADVLNKQGKDIFEMAETAINKSPWDQPGVDLAPMIDRMQHVEALTADLKRDLFEILYSDYPDYRIELNNLLFPIAAPQNFEGGAKGFRNALVVWSEHRDALDGTQRQEFVALVNTARTSFALMRQNFLDWESEREQKIAQTRLALKQ